MRIVTSVVLAALIVPLVPFSGSGETVDYEIIPMIGKAPSWWTEEARAAADRAGAEGKLYRPITGESSEPAAAGLDVALAPDYLFIRPGALFLGDNGALCTYNFIYGAGTKIGTAGHCVEGVGETVYILAVAGLMLPLVSPLGTVSSFKNGGIGNDWALISINTQWLPYVDPNMAYVGGPSCSAWNGSGGVVKTTGHGIQTGLVASVPRVSQAGPSDGKSFTGIGEVSGGDSGSPMIHVVASTACSGGSAAGIVTHCLGIIAVCLPIYYGSDIRIVPATVTTGFDPL